MGENFYRADINEFRIGVRGVFAKSYGKNHVTRKIVVISA